MKLPPMLRGAWLPFLILVLLAFAWRMPYAASKPIGHVDEVSYSLPTAQRLLAGEKVLYISGTNYGAPVQEALAAVVFKAFGESTAGLRLPTVVIGSLAVGLAFLALRRATGPGVALGIGLFLALANSTNARYTTFAHPCYATALAMVGCIQLATLWCDTKRTFLRWLVLGTIMGAAFYVLTLTLFQSFVSLAWLAVRSEYFQRLRERITQGNRLPRLRAGIFTAALGLLVLSPVGYHYLTRRATYVISPLETAIAIVATVLIAAGAIIGGSTLCAPRRGEIVSVTCCLAMFTLLPMPAAVWFRTVEQPRLVAQHIEPYSEATYNFKHRHEWPNSARLLMQGVFPALLIGRFNEVRPVEESEHLGWKAAVAAAILLALAAAAICRGRTRTPMPRSREADAVFIGPLLLLLIVLCPSWLLHSELSVRYLEPFLAGFFLLCFRCLERWIATYPRTTAALGGSYIAYCAVDCFYNIT